LGKKTGEETEAQAMRALTSLIQKKDFDSREKEERFQNELREY
jgi:hypothetical protein